MENVITVVKYYTYILYLQKKEKQTNYLLNISPPLYFLIDKMLTTLYSNVLIMLIIEGYSPVASCGEGQFLFLDICCQKCRNKL